ncbi:MAG: TolC family protein [Bacteroidales bacterium]|nr:TolC family protein [Bacteroidales bacterium]
MNKKVVLLALIFGLTGTGPIWAQQLLKLQDAMQIAAKNSPDIKVVEFNLIQQQELLKAQEASYKASFKINLSPLSYSNDRVWYDLEQEFWTTTNLKSSGNFNIAQQLPWTDGTITLSNSLYWQQSSIEKYSSTTSKFNNNVRLQFDQPLFTYNHMKLELNSLKLSFENSKLNYNVQMLQLEKSVTTQFYTVYNQQMKLQISLEEYNNQIANFELIKNKVEGGLLSLEELYQAELNLATSKSSWENAKVSLDNSKDNFKMLIGMDIFNEVSVLADPVVDSVPVDMELAIKYALENRMELRQRQISIENAQASLTQTKANNAFQGNLSLSVGLVGDDANLTDIYHVPTDNEQVALSLQIPIFDWGERKARIKASETQIETQKVNYEDQKNTIVQTIRQSYRNLQNLLNQITIAEQNVKNAQLTYDINKERYANGDLTGMDLSLYQSQLSSKKLDLINAQINYKLEILNMKIQTLYDWETKISIVPSEYKKN